MTQNTARGSNSPSNRSGRSALNDPISQWIRMWATLGTFAPQTDTETTTTTVTGDHNVITVMTEEMEAKNPSLEEEIVRKVASYGKQLGRINDALSVLVSLVVLERDSSNLQPDERQALQEFSELFRKIAKKKGEHVAPNEADLELLLREIQGLEVTDRPTYERMMMKLRNFANSGQPE